MYRTHCKSFFITFPAVFSIICVLILSACSSGGNPDSSGKLSDPIRVHALNGPTAISFMQFADDPNYSLTIDPSLDILLASLSRGEIDIAAIPSNAAAALFNNGSNIKVIDINTLSPLYKVSKIYSLPAGMSPKKASKICASGKGSIPEIISNLIYEEGPETENSAQTDWVSSPAQCVAGLEAGVYSDAILPEPYASAALKKDGTIYRIDDLGAKFKELSSFDVITGVTIASAEFIDKNPEGIANFLSIHKASIAAFNQNPNSAVEYMQKFNIYGSDVINEAQKYIGVDYIAGEEMKAKLEPFYGLLLEKQPKLIGGKLPDSSFYL